MVDGRLRLNRILSYHNARTANSGARRTMPSGT
jgi:hypothetical protein